MSLRDALLKAGKVSKKDAQNVRTEKRRKRKKKGGHRLEKEALDKSLALDQERLEAQAAANREIAEQQRRERLAQERGMQIRNLIQAWQRRPGRRATRTWHFVRSNGHVGAVMVDSETAAELEYGAAGIVELPEDRAEARVLKKDGIRKLAGIYGDGIRFFVGDGGPSDPLVRPAPRARRTPQQ